MRLKRLQLTNYGCFRELDLGFATEPGQITLITAPNGSGKSVLRQAFHDILFDIPVQSPMRFRHGYAGMALHAEATGHDGVAFSFGWTRNGKPPRTTDDPARFEALRYGVTPQQLEQLFALDTDRLRKGGTDLKGGATLSAALLAGTGELASAKSVRAAIDKRRQENWGQGKSKPPLNAAAVRLDAARKRLRDAVQPPETRVREERELARRADELTAARDARDRAADELKLLNRVTLTRSHLAALAEADAWLLHHRDAPALPLTLSDALAAARNGVALAAVEHAAAQDTLRLASEALSRIARDLPCVTLGDRLETLPGMLGEAEKAAADLVDRHREHAASLDNVRAELEAIGSPFTVDQATKAVPSVGLRAELGAAIKAEVGLRTRCEVARSAVLRAEAALGEAAAATGATVPLPDGLPAVLAEIRADRNPATHADEIRERVEVAAADVRRCLASVPGWSGDAARLRDAAVKSDAEFERLDAAVKQTAAADAEWRVRHGELAEQDGRDRRALATLQDRDLPDASAVAAIRAERDRGMSLVVRRAFGEAPSPAEERAYGGAEPVAVVYERQVRAADAIADRRVEVLAQAQEAERLRSAIAAREVLLGRMLREGEQAATARESARQAWSAAVAPLELDGRAGLAELRHVSTARRRLVDALHTSDIAVAAQAELTRRHGEWAARLAATLGVAPGPLGSLLARADQLVAAWQAAERASAERDAAVAVARRAVPEARDTLADAEARMGEWRHSWQRLLHALHRPDGESPAAVAAVLDGIERLDKHHRVASSLAARIAEMGSDLGRFASVVADLAAKTGEPPAATPAETARHLIQRHRRAAAAEAAWSQSERAHAGAADAARTASEKLGGAQAVLAGVVAACGAPDAPAAEARLAASRDRAEQVARRERAMAALAEHGDHLGVDTLRLQAEAVPVEAVAERRRGAEAASAAAQARAEAAAVAFNELGATLAQASSATDALDARADYEAVVAEYDRLLEEQLVLHLASDMLGDAMQVVADSVGGTTLASTSSIFAAFTDGAYGLELHDGPDGEELYAVEHAFPNERKALHDLSEGTRDQLYLALRVQALREHCATQAPLPFIADDILQTFDDDRARAALRTLCDLSEELQVIVLTHHPHLTAVARSLGPNAVRCLDLAG